MVEALCLQNRRMKWKKDESKKRSRHPTDTKHTMHTKLDKCTKNLSDNTKHRKDKDNAKEPEHGRDS